MFIWATQFLTVAYYGAYSPNVSFKNDMNFPGCLALQVGGGDLKTVRVSMLLKSSASSDVLPFSLCNKKKNLQFCT